MEPKKKRLRKSSAGIKRPPAIPPKLSMERFNAVCNLISSTTTGAMKACKELGVNWNGFYGLIANSEEAREIYARSKSMQVEGLVEGMIDIADAPVSVTEHGYDSADVQNKRVRIDTRKWLASKLLPKKYGDHVDITSGGEKLQQPPATLAYRIVEGRVKVGADNAAD